MLAKNMRYMHVARDKRLASGVSLKIELKMLFRGVDFRSVEHFIQKLWPVMDFPNLNPLYMW